MAASSSRFVVPLEPRVLLAAFQPPLAVPELGDVGQVVAKGDFNEDGYVDLVVTGGRTVTSGGTSSFDGGVRVLLNDRTGAFAAAGALRDLPFAPTAIVAGDFDGDGDADVAVAAGAATVADDGGGFTSTFDGGVYVMRGDGDGGLGPAVRYVVNDGGTRSLILGDFDGNGRPDIAAAGFRVASVNPTTGATTLESQVTVLRSNGVGTFSGPIETRIAGNYPLSIATVDYDNDGLNDLAVGRQDQVQFLQSKGDGTFEFPASLPGGAVGTMTSADLNRDGRLDLVWTTSADGVTHSALSRSRGGFANPVEIEGSSDTAGAAVVGDFTGDGRQDVLSGSGDQLYVQQADGSFAVVAETVAVAPRVAGDFNLDGRDDVANVEQESLAVPPPVFTTPRRTLVINGTRRADNVAATVSGSRVVVTINGETWRARLSRVRRIQVTTGRGNDTVTIDPSVFSPTLILAGGGADVARGGSGNDSLVGDDGDDSLLGAAGVDTIQGGAGADTVNGQAGTDSVFGGTDTDVFDSEDAMGEMLDRSFDERVG